MLDRLSLSRRVALSLFVAAIPWVAGCGGAVRAASSLIQDGNRANGITYYIGGAGPVGNVGFLSVPSGMTDAGYLGYVEIFTWQGFGAALDQVNISRNRGKALELANLITRHKRRYPGTDVDIVALSAGTGIATFALEYLSEQTRVRNVAFLGCSLSSRYDLTRALRRVDGKMYVFYSPNDEILRRIVPYTGTIDRADSSDGIAGLRGFEMPRRSYDDTKQQYLKVRNIAWRPSFAAAGWSGGHMDSTAREFIARYVAPLILDRGARTAERISPPVERERPPTPKRRRTSTSSQPESAPAE